MSKLLHERGSGSLPSLIETNPKDHVKSISTIEEVDTPSIRRIGVNQYVVSSLRDDGKIPLIELSQVSILFPGHLKE
ncbi:hypothetical protein Tco_1351365 [Tanacetum coccineum]